MRKKFISLGLLIMALCCIVAGDACQSKVRTVQPEKPSVVRDDGEKTSAQTLTVGNARTNWIKDPVGVDTSAPSFSWELSSDERDVVQTAYRLHVWQKGDESGHLLWDSGEVFSPRCNGIVYDGERMRSHTSYEWKVTVWDNQGGRADTRGVFRTAYVGDEPFLHAKMIRMQEEENVYGDGQAVFFKDFDTGKQIKEATLYISALGIYEAYINGTRIGDALLAPGWSNYEKSLYYNTYDITDQIAGQGGSEDEGGANRIAVMLGTGWWCGRVAFGTYDYHKPALIATLRLVYEDGGIEQIDTDESWYYVKDTAVVFADIFNGEVYDAHKPCALELSMRNERSGMTQSRQAEISTDFAGSFHSFYGYPVKNLEQWKQSPVKIVVYDSVSKNGTDYGEIRIKEEREGADASDQKEALCLGKGETAVFDLGQNMAGVPYISYEAEDGTLLTVDFAEMLNDSGSSKKGNDGPGGSLYTANYRSAESALTLTGNGQGVQEYQPSFTYYGFRYLSVTATGDVVLHRVEGRPVGNSCEMCGWLETDNELLNRLYENVTWTQRNNYLLVATDCPQRDERLGWMGDLQVFAKTSMYNQDLISFYQKWSMDCMESQTPEGAYTDTVPRTIITGSGNAGWGDAGISVPLDVYRMYGDEKLLRESYPSMSLYMDYLASVSDFEQSGGRIGPLTLYGDWLGFEDTDKELVSALYYAKDAMQMEEIAGICEDSKKQRSYRKLYQRIRKYFRNKYMEDGRIRQEYCTQTALVLAMEYGMMEREEEQTACETLLDKLEQSGGTLTTGFLGTPVLLKALSEHGFLKEAYDLLLQTKNPSWLYSILQGATTIWERYDSYTVEKGFADAAMNSFDHFNNGSVAAWMYESMLGICMNHDNEEGTPPVLLSPGIVLDADRAPVRSVKGGYHSIYGEIEASFLISKDEITYQVHVPANCQALLKLPLKGDEAGSVQTSTIGSGDYTFTYQNENNRWICDAF